MPEPRTRPTGRLTLPHAELVRAPGFVHECVGPPDEHADRYGGAGELRRIALWAGALE
jgi:hypothetical protein